MTETNNWGVKHLLLHPWLYMLEGMTYIRLKTKLINKVVVPKTSHTLKLLTASYYFFLTSPLKIDELGAYSLWALQ